MRTVRCATIVMILSLSAATTATFAAEPELSNTRSANSIVRIRIDPGMLPLNPPTIESMIFSSAVAAKAAREVLGLDADAAMLVHEVIEIEWLAQGSQASNSLQPETLLTGGSIYEPMYGGGNRNYVALVERTPSQNEVKTQERADENPQDQPSQTDSSVSRMMGGMDRSMGRYDSTGMRGRTGTGSFGGMGGGMEDMYGMAMAPSQAAGIQQSATIKLSIQLPDDVKPAADEFLQGIVRNLRDTLRYAYERHEGELADLVRQAEGRHESALEDLAELLGAKPSLSAEGTEVDTALSTVVDLSSLTPEMPFAEAIELLKNSVSPPLQMTVMWRDLLDNADIEPATPINMDPLSHVEVKTALEIMLKAVSGGLAEPAYRIQGNVIVIGTAEGIETPQQRSAQPRTEEADIQELAAWRRELRRSIRAIEMDLASMDARRKAIEEQIVGTRVELAERQRHDEITQELAEILQTNEELLRNLEDQARAGRIPESDVIKAKENMMKARIELARRREELAKSAGGGQLNEFNSELSQMAIEKAESQARLNMLRRQLDETQMQLDQAATFDPKAARIRAAREAADAAERRVATLNRRLANLEPPAVSVIGTN